ncbi:hypothetical protein V494_06894 [Pseudogymnoascus sp. VKM F-4513 (FW-928)]|nr:hypothetical protein V494_06894 [Pseudogymnoascus sp. VKM F-4513 (FW-928)]
MGWLLSCKQAYVEGIDVLYRTNTIHISSPVLMRSIQDVLSGHRLESIACLELVWQPKMLPLKLGFTDNNTQWHHISPTFYERHESNILAGLIFPCLRILRISFARLIYNEKDYTLGIEWPYRNKSILSHRLRNHFLPTIDRILERAVPPTTDVTVSCSKWDWYQEIDHVLMETQGVEETRMQHAGIKEFRCWRNTPQEVENLSDSALEDAIGAEERRKGFWIHAYIEEEDYEGQLNYGLNRRDVYNLGPEL